jgi:uracil-DNA glycosylase
MLFDQLHAGWQTLLGDQRDTLARLDRLVESESNLVPESSRVLAAFATDPASLRVVIVGQDPYPNPSHAVGLAFAVPAGTAPLPPTLKNIYRELNSDVPNSIATPDLSSWANRGVMLLNRHLTTRAGQSAAHVSWQWSSFTDAAVSALVELQCGRMVAILWGNRAQELKPRLGSSRIISSAHPSPLSSYRGFFGSRPFSRANQELVTLGLAPIDWS